MSMMYEDLAQLELKLKQLIQQQQEEKAAAAAGAVPESKLDGKAAGRPLIEVEAVGVDAN